MSDASDLNSAIVEAGNARGGLLWRHNTGSVHLSGGRYLRFGYPGSGDVIGCYRGRFVSIETKTVTDRERISQKLFKARIEQVGGHAIFARSIDDALALFDEIDHAA